jgi:hypothetical protein
MVVTLQLITQFGQLIALGSVGKAPLFVATVIQYLLAPETPDQLNVVLVETPAEPLAGPDNVGAASSIITVKAEERADVPAEVCT